jgi:hypothetical protein
MEPRKVQVDKLVIEVIAGRQTVVASRGGQEVARVEYPAGAERVNFEWGSAFTMVMSAKD